MYESFILYNMPRVLSQIDRDNHSTTYGSCDRNYWHLKLRDFSSAILQQSGLPLALAYELDFPGNIYYKNENIRKWSIATLDFWGEIQLRDGSYNEYYPCEHGYPPTAFSLYTACEIYKRMNVQNDKIKQKIYRTCRYLLKNSEKYAYNQEVAAMTALYNAFVIFGESWMYEGSQKKLSRILELQSDEGWIPEHGGADLGYLSVSFDMLAEYYSLSKDERVKEPLKKMLDFIQYFVHPDITIGGEYGSRNTTYFLPNGLQILACEGNGLAERIIQVLYSNPKVPNYFMDSIDDRYFSHYVMHSFLRALEKRKESQNVEEIKLPFEYNHHKFFEEAGLVSFKNDKYSAFFSLKKGGVIKIYDINSEKFIDCGYRVNYGKGNIAVTNWLDNHYKISFDPSIQEYKVCGYMNKIKLKVPNPILLMGLRVTAFLLGDKLKLYLKKLIILVDKHDDIKFERIIKLKELVVEIEDKIESDNKITIEKASNMSVRFVASGKFFMKSDLNCESCVVATAVNNYEQLKLIDINCDRGKV